MPAINLRLAHYPSRTPILLEVRADASITAQELRSQIEDRFSIEDTCRMRMFGKWYYEVNGTTQFIEIVSSDSSDSLSSLGITDGAILYLEGRLLDAQESRGKAIPLQPSEPQSIKGELPKRMCQVDCQQLAKRYHARYPDMPLKALWEALIDKSIGVDVVMAIVEDPSCGLNRTSTSIEGTFTSQRDAADPIGVLNRVGDCTPLLIATLAGRVDVVQTLVAQGVSIMITDAISGRGALHVASHIGSQPIIEILLAKGADVNVTNNDGWSPLHIAAQYGHLACVECLIAKGADVKATAHDGRSPLHIAAQYGHLACVECLIAKGADVNATDNDGWPPLHTAALLDHLACVECLIAQGADVNATHKDGRSPLHIAAQYGHLACVECLIAKGADVNATNKDGRSPLHIAAQYGHLACVECLITEGDVKATSADATDSDRSSSQSDSDNSSDSSSWSASGFCAPRPSK